MKRTARMAVPLPVRDQAVEDRLRAVLGLEAQAYRLGACHVLVAEEPAGWHLSISHPTRYPTWDEITAARYALVPATVDMVLHLPPPDDYVNVYAHCFHLWEHPPRRGGER